MFPLLAASFGGTNEAPSAPAPEPFTAGDFYGSFVQVIVVLAVIIGLIVVLIRFLAARTKRWSGERSLQVHAGVPLGTNKSLQVVEIGDTIYIVGVGDDVTLLDKIDDPEAADALIASLASKPAPAGGAAALLSFLRGARRKPAEPPVEEWQSNEAFRELLARKLNGAGGRKEAMKAWMEEEDR